MIQVYRVFTVAVLAFGTAASAPAQAPAPAPKGTVRVHGVVDGEAVTMTARRYLGVPYRLGGSTPHAFDCSGFVRWVFAAHDIDLPRTAHEQAAIGYAPPAGDLEPGDLLFFYGGRGAQHIAIYVGGDTIIHASSSSHRVRLDRLSGTGSHRSWFGRRLIAVRRILPAAGVFELPAAILAAGDTPPGADALQTPPRIF